jgi:hypothetical protein
MHSYILLGYLLERVSVINPYNLAVSIESGNGYQKTSAELNYKYSYYGKKSGLDLRMFTGMMLKNVPRSSFYAFSPGGRGGREQYMYEGVYPDRFSEFPKTFWSRQMTLSEGSLVSAVNDTLGYSKWICSLSLTSSLPGVAAKVPVKPFINLLLNDHGTGTGDRPTLFFEAGLKAGIWDLFEVYFPLVVSGNIESITHTFRDRIRFVFRLDKLNPFRSKSQISD